VTQIVAGLGKFKANLNKLDRGTRGKILENAVLAGALLVSNAAKVKAPYITGTLKRSIHVGDHVGKSSPDFTPDDVGGTYSDVGGKEIKPHSATLLVGTNLIYAASHEFGDPSRNIPAQSYLRPALAENEKAVQKEIGDAVKVLIKKALRGI